MPSLVKSWTRFLVPPINKANSGFKLVNSPNSCWRWLSSLKVPKWIVRISPFGKSFKPVSKRAKQLANSSSLCKGEIPPHSNPKTTL